MDATEVKKNWGKVESLIKPTDMPLTALERVEIRHAARTPEQVEAIKNALAERQSEGDNRIEPTYTTECLTMAEIKKALGQKSDIDTEAIFAPSGTYSLMREELHKTIINQCMNRCTSYGGNTIFMLGGAPANGKSTLVDSGLLPYPKGALVVDPDKIKAMLPEYQIMSSQKEFIPMAANFVHEESSYIGKSLRLQAFEIIWMS